MTRTSATGEDHYAAKLTEDDVREIKRRLGLGESIRTIASDYEQVSPSAIAHIKSGRSWSHV